MVKSWTWLKRLSTHTHIFAQDHTISILQRQDSNPGLQDPGFLYIGGNLTESPEHSKPHFWLILHFWRLVSTFCQVSGGSQTNKVMQQNCSEPFSWILFHVPSEILSPATFQVQAPSPPYRPCPTPIALLLVVFTQGLSCLCSKSPYKDTRLDFLPALPDWDDLLQHNCQHHTFGTYYVC